MKENDIELLDITDVQQKKEDMQKEFAKQLVKDIPLIKVYVQDKEQMGVTIESVFFYMYGPNSQDIIALGKRKTITDSQRWNYKNTIGWLSQLNHLINSNPFTMSLCEQENYILMFQKFMQDKLTDDFLFTQEGYDILTGKQYLTSYDEIVKTTTYMPSGVLVPSKLHGQFLDGSLFHSLLEYDDKYFLNYYEYAAFDKEQVEKYVASQARRVERLIKSQDTWLWNQYCSDIERGGLQKRNSVMSYYFMSILERKFTKEKIDKTEKCFKK